MKFNKLQRVALVCVLLWGNSAHAQLTANAGYVSEYIFRGILQKNSSAYAGVDYASPNGFYIGVWGADVGQGLETDLYLGYTRSNDTFSYSVGTTGYFYTDDFDDTYTELNLSGSYGLVTIDAAFGQYDNFDGPTQDYTFVSATVATQTGLSLTAATFSQDFDGEYFQLSYGFNVAEDIALNIDVIHSTGDLLGGSSDNALVLGVAKTFQIRD